MEKNWGDTPSATLKVFDMLTSCNHGNHRLAPESCIAQTESRQGVEGGLRLIFFIVSPNLYIYIYTTHKKIPKRLRISSGPTTKN